ncbi:MobC family plasmid mobilization relaxosome protein [Rhodococcus aerolatus]
MSAVRRAVSSRRRRRVEGGRPHKVTVRFSDEEFEAVSLHAAAARVSVPHYVALRALDAPSRGGARSMDLATMRTWATEMFSVRRELNRVGINLNQIARLLNGTGEVARGAERTLAATETTVERIGPITDWLLDTSGMGRP